MDDGIDVLMSGGFRKNGMVEVQLQAKAIDVLLENTEVHFDEYDLLEQVGALEYKTDEITGLCVRIPSRRHAALAPNHRSCHRPPAPWASMLRFGVTLGTSQPHIPACTHPSRQHQDAHARLTTAFSTHPYALLDSRAPSSAAARERAHIWACLAFPSVVCSQEEDAAATSAA